MKKQNSSHLAKNSSSPDVTIFHKTIAQLVVKRIFDLTCAVLGLILLSPLLLIVSIFIVLILGHPVLFRQKRPGKHGQLFTIYKFRTMLDALDMNGKPLPDDKRLTRFGQFLRSTSIDELPELFNVVRNEMSLVGPRPLMVDYLKLYSPEQNRRHDMLPGITGWAQINGRNLISWEEKLALDVWYIDHYSFRLDLQILMKTVLIILNRKGIAAEGHVTMPPFTGSQTK